MKWISAKDSLPLEYNKYYLLLCVEPCEECDKGIDHPHRLNFRRYEYDIGLWVKADLALVEYYRALNDYRWDFCAKDRFCERYMDDREIDFWMPFPNEPNASVVVNSDAISALKEAIKELAESNMRLRNELHEAKDELFAEACRVSEEE